MGLKPGAAGWKAQIITLSYGSTPRSPDAYIAKGQKLLKLTR